MKTQGTKKHLQLLLSVFVSAVLLVSAPGTFAKNDLPGFADKVLAQALQSKQQSKQKGQQQRQSQSRKPEIRLPERRNSNAQNELIDSSRSRAREEKKQERVEIRVSLDQAVSQVRRSSGGKVIKASTSWSNGKPVHNIRVLTEDNRVRTYRIDGVSGRQL